MEALMNTLISTVFNFSCTVLYMYLVVREKDLNPGPPNYKSSALTIGPRLISAGVETLTAG